MSIKQEVLKSLDKVECGNCPLKKSCNLNLVIYERSLCEELR